MQSSPLGGRKRTSKVESLKHISSTGEDKLFLSTDGDTPYPSSGLQLQAVRQTANTDQQAEVKVIASHSLFTTQLPPFGRECCLNQRTTVSPSASFVSTFCWRNDNSLVKQHFNNFHERHHAVVTGMRTSMFQTKVVNTRGKDNLYLHQ